MTTTGARAWCKATARSGALCYLLSYAGMRVVAVTDARRRCVQPCRLDHTRPRRSRRPARNGRGFEMADPLDPEKLWETECELAGPRRPRRNHSPPASPRRLGAKVVVEAANGPTLPEADPILERRGTSSLPDILANGPRAA